MDKSTIDMLAGIISIIMGIWFIVSYKSLAQKTAKFYHKAFDMHYEEKPLQFVFIIAGILLTILGILTAMELIKYK